MKLNKITAVAAAISAAAVLSISAQAQVFTSYSSGDVLLGFNQSGNASDYIVDLGSVSQFIGITSPVSFQLSTADLSNTFTSSWASNSATNLVSWGAVANDQGLAIASDTDGSSVWYTKGELTTGTHTAAPIRGSSSALNSISNRIQNLDTGTNGYDSSLSTANANNGVVQSTSTSNSWASFGPNGANAFNIGASIEQPVTGNGQGPTNSVLDFYEVDTKTASNQPATLLGTFTLNSSGDLTFTEVASTPEPSAFALGLTAVVLFVVLKRRKMLGLNA
jgi:hypothetical protein